MFTGIVEEVGVVQNVSTNLSNKIFELECSFISELKVDQSVSHNGVCLTVTEILGDSYKVTAIDETLLKSNLSELQKGDLVNLERCMKLGDRLDGHIVQGHVDTTGVCTAIVDKDGSWLFTFSYNSEFKNLVINKGSISINGTSLTVIDPDDTTLQVAIIPYTYEHTNFKNLVVGQSVNLEFDIIGKYIARKL